MVTLPQIIHLFTRYFAYGFPAFLDVVEAIHGLFYLFLTTVGQNAHFLNEGFLTLEVLFLLSLHGVVVFLTERAVARIEFAELLIHLIYFCRLFGGRLRGWLFFTFGSRLFCRLFRFFG